MTDHKRYQELASKWLDGTITEAEKSVFTAWYNAHSDNQVKLPPSFANNEEELKQRILTKIKEDIDLHTPYTLTYRFRRFATVAAVLLGLLTVGVYVWRSTMDTETRKPIVREDVLPGGNRATLTLADGRTITLSGDQSGIIIGDEIRYENGEIIADNHKNQGDSPLSMAYNTVTTPKGGQYQIVLPDGSKVWLNSASSLRYPSTFAADRREVELTEGEAYFEVSKLDRQTKARTGVQKVPFLVKTKLQTVEVLGTEFNINAYQDEDGIRTTLIEGSVRVHRENRGQQTAGTVLAPGEQSKLTDSDLQIHKVDTEAFIAWKDGFFFFNDADIYDVMRQFSRWYDIDVQYKINVSDDLFVGKIPKNVSLSTALNVLKSAGVDFELKDGRFLEVKSRK